MNAKHISIIVAVVALLAGCAKSPIEESGVIEAPDNSGGLADLELAYVGSTEVKSVIDGKDFPQTGEIGLFLFTDEAATTPYGETGYTNVKYAYNSTKGKWTASPSIKVGSIPGHLYGYYPYSSTATDVKEIPVESSLNGDDVMYATKQTVNDKTASQTAITMNHALARVSIKVINNGYTGKAELSKIKFSGAKIAQEGTLNALDGKITATNSDVTLDVPTANQTITATGSTYECLLVPSGKDESKQAVDLTLTIDDKDMTATLSGDNGVIIAQNTKSNITITLSNKGISVSSVSIDEWKEVEVGGHKVTVKFDEGAPGIEENVLVTAYAKNGDVIIKSFSSNGKKLSFRRDDTGTILGIAPQDNIYDIVLSEVNEDITVTIDYFLNSNPEFTTISGHKVSVVLDADTDILKGISIDNNDKLVIEAESSYGNPVKCVKDGERIVGSKTGTLYKFTISDITDNATVTIGYSKYTATIGFAQGSVTDKATLKINGDEVEAGGSTSVFEGTNVEYSAVVDNGYLVLGWYDNNGQKVSDAESFTVSGISSDVAYYAEVKAGYKLTVNTIYAGTSTIAANGVSIESGRAYIYDPNTQITLTASPATGCQFAEWCDADGKTLSTENPYSFTLSDNLTIIAVFSELEGALSGVFTVSDDGNGNVKKVRFSKGNLYYDGTQSKYFFEAKQYDVPLLTFNKETDNHVGHFYWSKDANVARSLSNYTDSGASDTDVFFTNDSENQAKPNLEFTVNGQTGFWRVLSGGDNGEWSYLLNSRNTAYVSNRRYAAVKVNGMAGLLIFPDDFSSWPSEAGDEPQTFDTNSDNWNDRNYTVEQFTVLQNNGCVFLPAAGFRDGNPGSPEPAFVCNVGDSGYYWSASPTDEISAYDLYFYSGNVGPSFNNNRYQACSVRLVTESK